MRAKYGNVKFMLMNSYSTSKDTLAFLEKYPDLAQDASIEFLQNKAPLQKEKKGVMSFLLVWFLADLHNSSKREFRLDTFGTLIM